MTRWPTETLVQRALMAALLIVCISSDAFLAQQEYLKDWALLRHLVDSSAHGAVACCCWGIFLCQTEPLWLARSLERSALPRTTADVVTDERLLQRQQHRHRAWLAFVKRCIGAGVAAALLDVDHFIAAGSFSIDGATHLKHRPFGHAVLFIVVVALGVAKCAPPEARVQRVCFVVVALLSHQLRDGMRLGLWCWPLGSTPPIPYVVYLVLEEALPFIMAWWHQRMASRDQALATRRGFELVAHSDRSVDDDEDSGDSASPSAADGRSRGTITIAAVTSESHHDGWHVKVHVPAP